MDKVLLKIKRQFTHDEAVQVLQNELKAARFKNGELLSTISEIQDCDKLIEENKLLKAEIEKLKATKKVKLTYKDLVEERFIELRKQNAALQKSNKRLRDEINIWRDKCLDFIAKESKIKVHDN